MIRRMLKKYTELMTAISPGGTAMVGQGQAAFTRQVQTPQTASLARPASAPAAWSQILERLICSA